MENDLIVLTPEKTMVRFALAGIGSRSMAQFLDLVLIFASIFAIAAAISTSVLVQLFPSFLMSLLVLAVSLGPFAYFIAFEGLWNGQTPGKRALGIRVRMADGTPITIFAALSRNLIRAGDFVPILYGAGLMAMMSSEKSQRLGDLVANTVVINERETKPRFVAAPHKAGIHYFESAIGDLRGMTPEEYAALRRFCDRFPELSPTVQERMVQEIWLPFARKRNVPAVQNVHPIYLAEAAVMKYGRDHGTL